MEKENRQRYFGVLWNKEKQETGFQYMSGNINIKELKDQLGELPDEVRIVVFYKDRKFKPTSPDCEIYVNTPKEGYNNPSKATKSEFKNGPTDEELDQFVNEAVDAVVEEIPY